MHIEDAFQSPSDMQMIFFPSYCESHFLCYCHMQL